MLCQLWEPTEFTFLEYITVKLSYKVMILLIKCVIYGLCLSIKIKKFFLNCALIFTRYWTVSSVVVLWLKLGYFYFSYLIRIFVFINRYPSLDCFTALSGKVFLQIFLLWCISLFCPLLLNSLWSELFYLLLCVDTVWYFVLYCFFSPCCDHYAGFWAQYYPSINGYDFQKDSSLQDCIPNYKSYVAPTI